MHFTNSSAEFGAINEVATVPCSTFAYFKVNVPLLTRITNLFIPLLNVNVFNPFFKVPNSVVEEPSKGPTDTVAVPLTPTT